MSMGIFVPGLLSRNHICVTLIYS